MFVMMMSMFVVMMMMMSDDNNGDGYTVLHVIKPLHRLISVCPLVVRKLSQIN